MNNPCVAHRGYSSLAPENTMAAFELAMEQAQVQWIELDVQLSRDGYPVVIHDYRLERTTNGKGFVKDMTLHELKQLDAGSWKSKKYAGERIPTLAEVLERIRGRVKLNIELKTTGDMYPHMPAAVLRELFGRWNEADYVITSFDRRSLVKVKLIHRFARTGLIINAYPPDLARQLIELKCDLLSIGYPHVNKQLISDMKKSGIDVMAWTVDSSRIMRNLAVIDQDIMLCTNNPELWQKAFAKKAMKWFKS
ncbi:glycerophosphodiester phosphodiesterase [Paenibacillus sp. FSL H7-0326]|uniref:glycerophosphodiester phosphodiesterase n=1 Tax=Paenibacillus sp. FSL H7-0326 TaxID=1921144 RepID=UPI00096C4B14|nr:glycerophosphodiester phosphodiesterase family protein [Paenibacillus sp. FSL H7-0326]OMC71240.1 glycerophosphodiester phosphodiesterase [Paenibacillus sp. FSL H7-0326]